MLARMRTPVHSDDEQLTGARESAVPSGETFTAVAEDALREMRARHALQAERPRVSLTTVRGRGIRPGIDLDSSASLLKRMEELEP